MGDTPLGAVAAGTRADGLALYDTTLRDGTQREGVNLSVDDKIRVARRMDSLGVHYLEGGWPGANPKDTEFFRRFAAGDEAPLQATLTAFGMTRMASKAVDEDPLVQGLVNAGTDVVCLVGKSWGYHVDEALGVPRAENLAMVTETIAHLRGLGRRVMFDAEHFFDGYARDRDYAIEVVTAAAEAGAEAIVLCDTNGGAMPWDVAEIVRHFVTNLDAEIGLHFHDDGGCAVANSMLGVEAGAAQVQGTANGLGERCGNANLFTMMADLQLKRGLALVPPDRLERLMEVSHAVAEICNQATPSVQPYVGHTAFSHKAGLHASAMAKSPDMYQHIDPGQVGNGMRMVVSELAGKSNIVVKGKEFGVDLDGDQAATVLAEVKQRESEGWTYEAADASFELLLRRTLGLLAPADEPFTTLHYRVSVGGGHPAKPANETDPRPAEAILAVEVSGTKRLGAGEGNGPVDALDDAFRNATNGSFPTLSSVHLSDYKVRILEASHGTDAVTRVLVTATDGHETWDTVGVHANVVEASWKALSDAYTYALLRSGWR